jgi:hypothetical protein
MTTDAGAGAAPDLDETGFQVLYEQLRRGADWGGGDRHGALNNITPAHVLAAVGEVRLGRTISMAALVEHEPAADNPEPWGHQMTYPADGVVDPTGLHFAMDRLAGNSLRFTRTRPRTAARRCPRPRVSVGPAG